MPVASISMAGVVITYDPGMDPMSLRALFNGSIGGDRFIVLKRNRYVSALDLHAVVVIDATPYIDVSDALTKYKSVDHAIVSCVFKSQMDMGDKQKFLSYKNRYNKLVQEQINLEARRENDELFNKRFGKIIQSL